MKIFFNFIPGPVEVREDVLRAMIKPTMSHRSEEFTAIFKETILNLQKFLGTKNKIFIATSSATGLMEAAIRNGVANRVINFANGAFAERWHDISRLCGATADICSVPWGRAIEPELVEKYLATGKYDAMTIVHNETSTGVTSPLKEISKVTKKYPQVAVLVDCVSILGGVRVDIDEMGLDIAIAGSQKALGLPPGIAIAVVSERLIEKAKNLPGRGVYFNFDFYDKHFKNFQPPTTPSQPLVYALHYQSKKLIEEGLEKREARHLEMAEKVRNWARQNAELFADEKFLSPTLTCVKNTRKEKLPTKELIKALKERGFIIANGYGRIKDETFRIAHMGDRTPNEVDSLLEVLSETWDER